MANTILEKTLVQADFNDALLATFTLTEDMMNGTVVTKGAKTSADAFAGTKTQSGVVFKFIDTKATIYVGGKNMLSRNAKAYELEATTVDGSYMLASPEVLKAVVGKTYGGNDARQFTNIKEVPADGFKLMVGDRIKVTAEFFATTPTDASETATLTAGEFVVA